jgi:UDP-3-O-[3-hydroxymyristoyl] glucosamine N-acyltransferase
MMACRLPPIGLSSSTSGKVFGTLGGLGKLVVCASEVAPKGRLDEAFIVSVRSAHEVSSSSKPSGEIRAVEVTLQQLAEWVDGEIDGNAEISIQSARSLTDAGPTDITFAADERHILELHHSPAAAALIPRDSPKPNKPCIRVHDPLAAFVKIFERLQPATRAVDPGIHPTAVIHPTARLGEKVSIAAYVVVGPEAIIGDACILHPGVVVGAKCRLGEEVVLHPHVVLYEGTIVGHGVVIHANSVIGADGFGYRCNDGQHVKVPQLGHVEIEDDVEIGACTTIDRGTFGATRIGQGTKIDNLVQIGHNCRIGKHNIIVAQAGVAGSSTTGDQVIIAGQAGIRDHVKIGARAVVGPQSGVSKDIPEGQWVLGSPAIPEHEFKLVLAAMFKLPEMRQALRRLEKLVDGARQDANQRV